jgi:hypothetical protein
VVGCGEEEAVTEDVGPNRQVTAWFSVGGYQGGHIRRSDSTDQFERVVQDKQTDENQMKDSFRMRWQKRWVVCEGESDEEQKHSKMAKRMSGMSGHK